ncbi:MAG TPA: hypothetical protein VFL19_01510 [Nitrospira sp.]|nr:hypothetical protein [Nitrospira sp.]
MRTQREIDDERFALELLQGDFTAVDRNRTPVNEVMQVVRR